MRRQFPGLRPEQLPEGMGAAVETVTISTHNGTHLDAPYHFHPTMDNGKRAITIDEVPLEWCFSDGVKLDFRNKPDGYVCTADDVKRELDRIGYTLKPLDIVLVNTAAGAAYGQPEFLDKGCGMGREATLFLTRQGVRVTGTDGWSWDAPFSFTAKRFAETGDPVDHLGRPQGRPRDRLLPHGEARQSRAAAAARLHGELLPGEDPQGIGRLDARGGDPAVGHRHCEERAQRDEAISIHIPSGDCFARSAMTCSWLKLPADQRVERNLAAAIDEEIQRRRRPDQRIFDAQCVPEPAVLDVLDDRHDQEDRNRN